MTEPRFRLDIDLRHLGVRETIKRVLDHSDDLGRANLEDALVELLDAAYLTSNPTKVQGYAAQPDAKVALVNEFKAEEERLLRQLDRLSGAPRGRALTTEAAQPQPGQWVEVDVPAVEVDQRWLAIARTDFQRAYMTLNRAVFQPQRIKLPEDE